jgi:hypothetical protein
MVLRNFFEVDSQNLPKTSDKSFLMHREVIVTKEYEPFKLIKVHYTGETAEFFVDAYALTAEPNYTNSISLKILRRNCDE